MTITGIFGGSFNPVHLGHTALAKQILQLTALDEVWLMVSPQNPLKETSKLVDDQQRLTMARIAVEEEKGIIASDYEIHLPKPSYTWFTLQSLSAEYPQREFVLIIGADNWQNFHLWYHYQEIAKNYRIIVYPRKNDNEDVKGMKAPSGLDMTDVKGVTLIDAELLNVSSTEIRRKLKAGESISELVNNGVEQYIRKEGLYV